MVPHRSLPSPMASMLYMIQYILVHEKWVFRVRVQVRVSAQEVMVRI